VDGQDCPQRSRGRQAAASVPSCRCPTARPGRPAPLSLPVRSEPKRLEEAAGNPDPEGTRNIFRITRWQNTRPSIGCPLGNYCACGVSRTAVSKGHDFTYNGLRYQVKANRPSGKPGSPVTRGEGDELRRQLDANWWQDRLRSRRSARSIGSTEKPRSALLGEASGTAYVVLVRGHDKGCSGENVEFVA
jgi:hypothetical protein